MVAGGQILEGGERASVVSSSRSEAADLVGVIVVAVLGQVEVHCLVTYDAGQGPGAGHSVLR